MGEEGKVLLKVLVNENGKVVEAGVMESSGYERLDASAMEAVRRWEFVAQERNGKVVASWVIVPVNFTLNS